MYTVSSPPAGPTTGHSSSMVGFSRTSNHSPTNLARWSILNRPLLGREAIKTVHIYDFDNTLFMTPLPNGKIWTLPTLGFLQQIECFSSGGWWHDPRFLAATGRGLEVEEACAWEGWWNEKIVSLIELSVRQKDALTILLTGRSVKGYSDLIQRMVSSKNLTFDIITLKPDTAPNSEHFGSTILFKCMFLEDVLNTYKDVEEVKVYEDRVKHIKSFENFFHQYNASSVAQNSGRKPLAAEVIQVAEASKSLDPVAELTVMQKVVDEHNALLEQKFGPASAPLQIKKTVFYTGYLLSPSTTSNLLEIIPVPDDGGVKFLGNNILIAPRPASQQILTRVGGLGNKVEFDVTGWGHWENKVWAALVKPASPDTTIYTENSQPMIVLAIRGREAKPIDAQKITNWQFLPGGQNIRISTVVGEKLLLRIEESNLEGAWHGGRISKLKADKNFYHQPRRGTNGRHVSSSRSGRGYRGKGRGGRRGPHGPGDRQYPTRSFNVQDMSFMSELYE